MTPGGGDHCCLFVVLLSAFVGVDTAIAIAIGVLLTISLEI